MELLAIARVSTQGQDVDGQLPAMFRWAAAEGHTLTTREVKASAFREGGSFSRVIDEVIKDKPAGVVVRRVDRLSRRGIFEGLAVLKRFKAAGIRVFISDLGDAAEINELMMSAMLWVAGEESRIKSGRTFDNHLTIAENNAWSGIPAFGYRTANAGTLNARLIPDAAERRLLIRLFRKCSEGYSIAALAEWAAQQQHVRHNGKPWEPEDAQVRKLLTHEPYWTGINRLTSKRDGLSWTHQAEPVVSKRLAARAGAALASRRNKIDYGRSAELKAPYEGLLYCPDCGQRLYLATQRKNGKTYERYQCRQGHGSSRKSTEAAVDAVLGAYVVAQERVVEVPGGPRAAELAALRDELRRVDITTDEGFERATDLRGAIKALEASGEAVPSVVTSVPTGAVYAALWASGGVTERRAVLAELHVTAKSGVVRVSKP